MRKRFLLMMACAALASAISITPASAMAYNVDGADENLFKKPTSIEPVIKMPTGETENINRSKDSSLIPPPFGSNSANTPGAGELLTPNISGVAPMPIGQATASAQIMTGGVSASLPPETSMNTQAPPASFTLPDGLMHADGSIGALKIPKLGLTVKVYEDESLESLAKGAGHFKSTSCWLGNIGIAGHNRGIASHFGKIHTLKNGDTITYATKLGIRTYSVYFVGQISETDYTRLGRTEENIITLITCVNDKPSLRWCVQAKEVK